MKEMKNKAMALCAVLAVCMCSFVGLCVHSEDSEAATYMDPGTSFTKSVMVPDWSDSVYLYKDAYVDLTITAGDWEMDNIRYRTYNGSNWSSWTELIWNSSPSTGNGLTFSWEHVTGYVTGDVEIRATAYYPDTGDEGGYSCSIYVCNTTNDTAYVGVPYSRSFYPEDGEITAFQVSGGSLPAGLSTGFGPSAGTISGTPTAAGTYYFTIRMTQEYYETGEEVSGPEYMRITVEQPTTYTHTVAYAANGGTGSMSNTVVTDSVNGNSSVTLASCGFTRSGYTFTGWKVGNTVYQPGQAVSVGANASVTATAQWSKNTLTATANNISAVSKQTYSNQIGASANNGGTLSYAVKSCTGGTATVNSSGMVTYKAPTVSSTSTYTVTVTVTGTFAMGGNMTKDVSFTVTVDPVLSFTNASTSGTLSVKGA